MSIENELNENKKIPSESEGSSDDDSENSLNLTSKRKRTTTTSTNLIDKNLKEKNKEHARNTRLRKKNFIDHLKQAIQELGRERDEDEIRLRSELTRIAAEVFISYSSSFFLLSISLLILFY